VCCIMMHGCQPCCFALRVSPVAVELSVCRWREVLWAGTLCKIVNMLATAAGSVVWLGCQAGKCFTAAHSRWQVHNIIHNNEQETLQPTSLPCHFFWPQCVQPVHVCKLLRR
jgi:hypothetical protein